MYTFRLTDKKTRAVIKTFEARDQGEAMIIAQEIEQSAGLTGTTDLWIEQVTGDWLAID